MDFNVANGNRISGDLWGFLLRWIGPNLYLRRTKLAHDTEGNGLELWRRLFTQYEGCDERVALAGRTRLHSFPRIKDIKSLDSHLDDWLDLLTKWGDDIGPDTTMTLFMRILPDVLRTEVHRRPELKNTELMKLVDWARHQAVWERSEILANQMMKDEKVVHSLSPVKGPEQALTALHQPPPRPPGGGETSTTAGQSKDC